MVNIAVDIQYLRKLPNFYCCLEVNVLKSFGIVYIIGHVISVFGDTCETEV